MIRYLLLLALFLSASLSAATIDEVKKRGELVCGVNTGKLAGFAWKDEKGNWSGFDVDMCHAVAAAVLGDAGKVRFVPLETANRIKALARGKIDMLARNTTWTLSRDLDMGVSFAVIVYFDGQSFMVKKSTGKRSALELDGARICVQKGSTSEVNVEGYFHVNRMKYELVYADTPEETLKDFLDGKCDAITSDHSQLHALRSITEHPDAYRVLPEVISQEPLSLAVREGDDRWRKVVQWTVFMMINAEYLGVDQRNVDRVAENARKPAAWPAQGPGRRCGTDARLGGAHHQAGGQLRRGVRPQPGQGLRAWHGKGAQCPVERGWSPVRSSHALISRFPSGVLRATLA